MELHCLYSVYCIRISSCNCRTVYLYYIATVDELCLLWDCTIFTRCTVYALVPVPAVLYLYYIATVAELCLLWDYTFYTRCTVYAIVPVPAVLYLYSHFCI